jgi:hypothetical protein
MNSIYSNLKSLKNVVYCFVATKSPEIISKIRKNSINEWNELKSEDDYNVFLYVNHFSAKEKGLISFSVINDFADYDVSQIFKKLMNGEFVSNYNSDSLISLSCVDKHHFSCITDFWGIMTHYWFQSDDTFICSNNIFMISGIIDGHIDQDALYDYLFFNAPRKDKTWFKDIKCLLPGQQLIFDIEKNSVKLSKINDFSNLFKSSELNIFKAVEEFFSKAKNKIGSSSTNTIALSSGTDSRTVLACLRHFDMKPNAISFGRNDMVETYKINKFINNIKIPWQLVHLDGFEIRFDELFSKGNFISNGLLNPFRTHYMTFYNQIKQGNSLFEGILGSEFIKGEIAIDAMTSCLHRDVITDGILISEAIEKYYPELPTNEKESFARYIESTYGKELIDINSSEGLRCYQQFAYEFIPSKIFGGMIAIVLANGISPYYPFLSPKILSSVLRNRCGIGSSVSLRKDFPGPIKCLRAEAEIVKYTDRQIFTSLLERNIRFKDVSYPLFLARMKNIYHIITDDIKTKKQLTAGQIDNRKIFEITQEIANKTQSKILKLNQDRLLTIKAIVNLSYIIEQSRLIFQYEQ